MGERSAGSTRIFRLTHTDPELVRVGQAARDRFERWSGFAGRADADCRFRVRRHRYRHGRSSRAVPPRATQRQEGGAGRNLHRSARSPRLLRPSPRDRGRRCGGRAPDRACWPCCRSPADVGAGRLTGRCRGRNECGRCRRIRRRRSGGGASTSHLAAQVGIYTPPLLAHHVRFTFAVDGAGWQSWIDKPAVGLSTYQHEAGPGRAWPVGGRRARSTQPRRRGSRVASRRSPRPGA